MESITIKLRSETIESLTDLADAEHGGNRSAAIRDLIDKGFAFDDLEAERDDLRRQLQEANRRDKEIGELVEYVEDERELRRRRERRKSAPVWRRAKYWVFGYD